MMARIIEPEWLDVLPAEDPSAVRSRADLRRVNWFMNNPRIVADVLRQATPRRVLDLGAGDGSFAARVAMLCRWRRIECVLLDQSSRVPAAVHQQFAATACRVVLHQRDAFDALNDLGSFDVIFSNLFLHHFAPGPLTRLLESVAGRCRLFVACEPRRSSLNLVASNLLALIGCNAVTRHDAVASVRAGFRGAELTQHWPANGEWLVAERAAGLFSHLFVAQKL